jgi:glycerate kinase
MAAASGLPLIPPAERNPALTSTRGAGELLVHALDQGARRIILGLGGSATNDGGAGFASALGYRLLDAEGRILPEGGAALARLAHIDASGRRPALDACEVLAACDVDNPLCGPEGASHVYGPQKGAEPAMAEELDRALRRFGEVVEAELGTPVLDTPGAGAAGGLGAGLMAFAGGTLHSGVDLVAEANGLVRALDGAKLAITGEGRIDGQSARGKVPAGVARLARARGVPVIAVAGALGPGYVAVYAAGIDAVFSIAPGPVSLEDAMAQAGTHLRDTAEALARLWRLGR